MRIDWNKFKKLNVETKSGAVLGKVKNFILQTDGQNIVQYEASKLFGKKYLINRDQVLNIDDKKIVVEDNIENVGSSRELIRMKNKKIDMNPVAMREE